MRCSFELDLASQLRKAGFEVIEADNADEAHALLTTKVHVDAMLTDIRMPGTIDGLELAKRTRRYISKIKIVIVSAYIDPYWDAPVDATFAKPLRIERLLGRLRQLLPPEEQARSAGR